MLRNSKIRESITIIAMCFVAIKTFAAEKPTLVGILDKYAQTQNKQQSYICKWQSTTQMDALLTEPPYTVLSGKGRTHTLYEFRYDGSRYSESWHHWGNVRSSKKFISKEKSPYNSLLWDGRKYFMYIGTIDKPGRLSIYNQIDYLPKNMKKSHISDTRWGPGVGLLRGIYKSGERVDFTLRNIRKLSLQEEKETIRGIDCYVIDAGKYKLWIDPEHGYNIAQAQIELNNINLSLRNVRFKNIDDIWIIEKAIITRIQNFKNGDFIKTIERCTLTEIKLNPDHNTLGSFLPNDIPNGTKVAIYIGPKRRKGAEGRITRKAGQSIDIDERGNIVSCTWQKGKVIDDANGLVVMDLRKKSPTKH